MSKTVNMTGCGSDDCRAAFSQGGADMTIYLVQQHTIITIELHRVKMVARSRIRTFRRAQVFSPKTIQKDLTV